MALLSFPSLQPNPHPPFRHRFSFKLPFPVSRSLPVPFTSEITTPSTSSDENNKQNNTKKRNKKQKLRPSFLEQTMDRWSVKIPSQRDTFPWENNRKSEVNKNFEFDGGRVSNKRLESIVEKLNVDLENVKSDRLNDLSCEGLEFKENNVGVELGNSVISAPWLQGEKSARNDFDFGEKNDGLKQNFELDGKDEGAGGEGFVAEIYERDGFECDKLKKHFGSAESSFNLNRNVEFDQNDERTMEEYLVEEEILEIPNFDGDKLKKSYDNQEAIEMPDKYEHSIGSKRMNVKSDLSIGVKSKDKPHDKPQVDFITNNPSLFKDSSFSSQLENQINSNADFQDADEPEFPTQIHELRTKNQKINTNFNKPTKSKEETRSSLSNSTHFSNPKPKTLDHLIPDLTVNSVTLPWLRSNDEDFVPIKSNTQLAERTLPEPELKRLRDAALRLKERLKVGPAGVIESLVELIHEKWRNEEVVKLRFEGPPSLNMKRTHQILEEKTGGIVIWRSGRTIALFRGMSYSLPCVKSLIQIRESNSPSQTPESKSPSPSTVETLLNNLGPRYRDWHGRDAAPVDADLLPGTVPGYSPPYRMLSYRTRRTLRDCQMTGIRRRARQMAPHFALGRNREHQGLAAAIVKLWEKSAIAKIVIKRGVPNTSNERMAEELKKLTGGTLVSRNKEYIVLYRGNDFVTPSLRSTLLKKQLEAVTKLDEEESARFKALEYSNLNYGKLSNVGYLAGTLAETREAKLKWKNQLSEEEREEIRRDLNMSKHASLVRFLERKLHYANVKIEKAEKTLAKVQKSLIPAQLPTDLETLTDEERSKFRRIGLKMKAFGFLGRRGVFDGTVQNMHLNWKNKELVKVVVKRKSFAQVKHIAINLEAESGGVLVSVDKTTKGHAIVLYRGKNYMRPHILRPKNLLSKKQALSRSIELQRREALLSYMAHLEKKIETLKSQLEEMREEKGIKNGERILQENDTCSDDEFEEEGDEAYLKTYASGDEEDDDNDENNYNSGDLSSK